MLWPFHRATPPQIIKPHRGEINRALAPRGMTICLMNADSAFKEIASNRPVTTSNAFMGYTPRGSAFDPSQGTGNRYVFCAGEQPAQCSLETLLYFATGPDATARHIVGMAEATPTSGVADRVLYLNTSNQFVFYIFDGIGAIKATSSTVPTAGRFYHVVGTSDGGNIRIFINGALEATAAAASGGYTGYTVPVLAVGYGFDAQTQLQDQFINPILYSIFSTSAWTPREVFERAADPFGFLMQQTAFDVPFDMVGGAGGGDTLSAQSLLMM